MSWWKKFVRSAENVFRGTVGKAPIGAQNQAPTASPSPSAGETPMGGEAQSNAGEGVVNYQTKGKPGLQQPGQPTGTNPTGTS